MDLTNIDFNLNANAFFYGTCWNKRIEGYHKGICDKVGEKNVQVAYAALKALANFGCTLVGGTAISLLGLKFKVVLLSAIAVAAITFSLAYNRPNGFDPSAQPAGGNPKSPTGTRKDVNSSPVLLTQVN